MQKTVETSNRIGYGVCVMAKTAMIGFDSPKPRGGRTATTLCLAGFLRPGHSIALFGRWGAGGLVPAGTREAGLSTRISPPFLRLTAHGWVISPYGVMP